MKTKRWLSLLVSLCMVLTLFPAGAVTARAEDQPKNGSTSTVTTWHDLQDALQRGGEITLANDVSTKWGDNSPLVVPVGTTATLDLHGQKVNVGTIWGDFLQVNGTLILMDDSVQETGELHSEHGGVSVNGSLTMNGGSITGGQVLNSIVSVKENGKFTLNNGEITGNNGEITGGQAGAGGGVNAAGTFTMNGGSISGSSATQGGGVYAAGTFTMNGGSISGNSANQGGGVFVKGKFIMTGGSITGNSVSGSEAAAGGGVCVQSWGEGAFQISGSPVITGNTAEPGEGKVASNVALANGTVIEVTDTLNGDAKLGVTAAAPDDDAPVLLTRGLTQKGGEGAFDALTCDSTDPTVRMRKNNNGEAELYVPDNIFKVSDWAGLQDALQSSGSYILLTKDVTAGEEDGGLTVPMSTTATLDLNGYTVDGTACAGTDTLDVRGNLTLEDSSTARTGKLLGSGSDDIVYIPAGSGKFTMNGGTITGGQCKWGAIYAAGTFTMTGGAITGNSGQRTGGIYMNGIFRVSGSPVITGNTVGTGEDAAASNVYLTSNNVIQVTGPLTEGAKLGVTTYRSPAAGTPVVVTSGLTENGGEESYAALTYDGEGDTVRMRPNNGEAELYKAVLSEWEELQEALLVSDLVRLDKDVTALASDPTLSVPSGKTVTLDLNGHTVNGTAIEKSDALSVSGNLTLEDSSTEQTGAIQGGGTEEVVLVGYNGSLTMNGGTITGGQSKYGGVYVSGTFEMNGGAVTGNRAGVNRGGGVYVLGTFRVSGSPVITGNTVTKDDSAAASNVYLASGKKIEVMGELTEGAQMGVTASTSPTAGTPVVLTSGLTEKGGAGAYAALTFDRANDTVQMRQKDGEAELYKAVLTDWEKLQVALSAGDTVTLDGDVTALESDAALSIPSGVTATLDLNGHTLNGTAMKVSETLKISGSLTLKDSSAAQTGAIRGGGTSYLVNVQYNGSFTMNGGTITGGQNAMAAVFASGTFEMNGGSITGNTSTRYGAVYVTGTFRVSGAPVIIDNTVGTGDDAAAGNVYLTGYKVIEVTGPLTEGARLGVTTYRTPTVDTPVVITSGLTENGGEGAFDALRYDGANDKLALQTNNGEAELYKADVSDWEKLQTALSAGESITLDKDVTAVKSDGALTVPAKATAALDLNGHTIDASACTAKDILLVEGTLTLADSKGTGALLGGSCDEVVYIRGGTCTMSGGRITGSDANYGNVNILRGGTLTMKGGSITGNTGAEYGGGVRVYSGTFVMEGGSISGNTAEHSGGGVYVGNGEFAMKGGSISGNTAENGGGVYLGDGTFNVSDSPVIAGNLGGNVYLPEGKEVDVIRSDYALSGALNDDARIGVTAEKPETFPEIAKLAGDIQNEAFTAGCSAFFSDDSAYTTELGGNDVRLVMNPGPKFQTNSLVLSGQIGVNFFMDLSMLSDKERADSYMEFTVSGETTRADYVANRKNATNEYYGFTCYVNSIQMAEPIRAVFHYTEDGQEKTIEMTYSVKKYISYFDDENNAKSYDEETLALIRSIADYGHYAQPFLSDYNGWKIGRDYAAMDLYYTKSYPMEEIKTALEPFAFSKSIEGTDLDDVTYSLNLDSDTAVNVFLKPKENAKVTASATFDGKTYEAKKQTDGRYRIQINSIPAHLLGETIEITGTCGGDFTVSVTALSYPKAVLNSEAFGGNAKNAMAAFYRYYASTMVYREKQNN